MFRPWTAKPVNAHAKTSLCTALFTLGLSLLAFLPAAPAHAAVGINSSVNFQGRLLNAAGAVVADGLYNMQFKLYQDGTGTVVANPGGTLMWTESWVYGANTPDNRVTVKNGYFSIPLGSICSFSATTCTAGTGNAQVNTAVDFNQDTLWLSTNIGTTASTTATSFAAAGGDGEMIPMRRLGSSVYALNAGKLGGLSSAGFIQNASAAQQTATFNILSGAATTVAAAQIQTVASATAPVLILKGGATPGTGGDLLQLQSSAAAVLFRISPAGILGSADVAAAATNSTGTTLRTGNSTTSGNTGDLTVSTGTATSGNSGNIVIDTGGATGGTKGSITIGTTNAAAIIIGALTQPTVAPTFSQCLKGGASVATALTFGSCGGFFTPTVVRSSGFPVSTQTAGATSMNINPAAVGDLILFTVQLNSSTITATSITGGNATNWQQITSQTDATNGNRTELWTATATATGSAAVAVTFSASTTGLATELVADSLTAGLGANSTWSTDRAAIAVNASSTTTTYPTLMSSESGEAYWGFGATQNTGSAGATSGFSYTLTPTVNHVIALNPSLTAGITYAPTSAQASAGYTDVVAVIARVSSIGNASINNSAYSTQPANFNVQAATSGSVTGVLQANASGTGDVLDLLNGSSVITTSFGSTGNVLIKPSTNAVNALNVTTSTGISVFNVDTTSQSVGIGTATPSRKLDVSINNSSVTAPMALLEQAGTGDATLEVKTAVKSWILGADASDQSKFKISSSTASASTVTFGKTSIGALRDSGDNNSIECTKYTTPTSGSVTSITVYDRGPVVAYPNNMVQVGMYNDLAGAPNTLLASSSSATLGADSWTTVPITANIVGGTVYWLCANNNSTVTTSSNYAYDTGAAGTNYFSNQPYGTWPLTYNPSGNSNVQFSFYASYTSPGSSYDSFNAALVSISDTGQTTFTNSINSTAAFTIQNAAMAPDLTVDSTIGKVTINQGSLTINGLANPVSPALASSATGGTLTANTYQYVLSATSSAGETQAIATTPGNVTTTGATSVNTLTWTAVPFATGYQIYRSIDGGTTWFVNTMAANVTSASDNGTSFTWTNVPSAGRPDLFNNSTGRLQLADGSQIRLDSAGSATVKFDKIKNSTITGNSNASGSVMVQADSFIVQDTTGFNSNLIISNTGATTFKNRVNSPTALQVQNSAGTTSIFTADTTNQRIVIGSNVTDANQVNFQLDSSSVLADSGTCSATVNQGAMYYNTSTNAVRACVNLAWEDLVTTGGLGIMLFGVVPDSGANPGDLGSVSSTSITNGPCKVSAGATLQTVSWTACTAYSGGRKVVVTASTAATTNAVAGQFQHLCISNATGQPVLTTAGTEVASLNTKSLDPTSAITISNPNLCLADIKFAAANNTITGIYDVRAFTTSQKTYASAITTAPVLGQLVKIGTTTPGAVTATTATADANLEGVVIATTGVTSTTAVNVIVALSGPGTVKAISGVNAVGTLIGPSTTAGYAIGVTAPTSTFYGVLGPARSLWTGATACAINSDACENSILVDIKPR